MWKVGVFLRRVCDLDSSGGIVLSMFREEQRSGYSFPHLHLQNGKNAWLDTTPQADFWEVPPLVNEMARRRRRRLSMKMNCASPGPLTFRPSENNKNNHP